MKNNRRASDYDVTGTVQVSCPETVCKAVREIFELTYPGESFEPLPRVFEDFRRLFEGEYPGFRGCDTVYHDMQHTLDITLAVMRLIGGYEKSHKGADKLGFANAKLGLVTALFHDSGYILRDEDQSINGAEYTSTHVSRGAQLMTEYLPTVGLQDLVDPATCIVHFTGYEKAADEIQVSDPKHALVGRLVGTADLMAQMADRCYLEKCRDRLFSEFVLGGIAVANSESASPQITYESGLDLLRKTPKFFQIALERMNGPLAGVYRNFESWFDGEDPYMASINQNQTFLAQVIADGDWSILRRRPPVFTTGGQEQLESTQEIAQLRMRDFEAAK